MVDLPFLFSLSWQAFTIYEDFISESKSQSLSITLFVSVLSSTRAFSIENYETLSHKTIVSASRLLKRVDQCRGVLLCSTLWESKVNEKDFSDFFKAQGTTSDALNSSETSAFISNPRPVANETPSFGMGAFGRLGLTGEGSWAKRQWEAIQRALRIAESLMDRLAMCELLIEVAEQVGRCAGKNNLVSKFFFTSLLSSSLPFFIDSNMIRKLSLSLKLTRLN